MQRQAPPVATEPSRAHYISQVKFQSRQITPVFDLVNKNGISLIRKSVGRQRSIATGDLISVVIATRPLAEAWCLLHRQCRGPESGLRLGGRGCEQRERAEQQRKSGEDEEAGAGRPGTQVRPGRGTCRRRGSRLARPGRAPGAVHAAGPLGRWAAGPLGRWAAGPLGRWAAGPLGRWAAGPLGRWAAGPLGRWAAGPLGYYTIPADTISARLSNGFSPRSRRQGGFPVRCVPVSALFLLRWLWQRAPAVRGACATASVWRCLPRDYTITESVWL